MIDVHNFTVPPEAAGTRLDHFLTTQLNGVSRARIQLLLDQGNVLISGTRPKPSLKLRGGEHIVTREERSPVRNVLDHDDRDEDRAEEEEKERGHTERATGFGLRPERQIAPSLLP